MRRGALGSHTVWTAAFVAAMASALPKPTAAQTVDGRPDGASLYAARCADCHGADATGVRGPDLTRLWGAGATDARVFQVIRQGIPGSIMPASVAPDAELHALVAYLKGLGTAPTTSREMARSGAASSAALAAGETRFWSTCGGCHRIGARGGRLGPDLTRIGVTQSPEALRTSIRDANRALTPGYQAVTLVGRDGTRIRGIRKNEDAFSVQVLDTRERLQGFAKADLMSVERDKTSLMPSYGSDRLPDGELDSLVAFLATLKGTK